MIRPSLLDEILHLPAAERLRLVEDVWDSLAASTDDVPVPEWHRAELDDRLADPTEQATISVEELKARRDGGENPLVIDVRSAVGRSIDLRRIPGALAIELDSVVSDCKDLARDREIVLYCNCPNEASAARAARLLAAGGFTRVRPLGGGLEAWVAAGHRVDEHDLAVAGA